MSTRLNMAFKSADGSTVTYSLDDPREDLTAVQVSTFMQDMIDADVFDVKGGLREIKEAEIVTTITEKLF